MGAVTRKHIAAKYGIRIFIAFVDEKLKKIYGNFLDELATFGGREVGEVSRLFFERSQGLLFPSQCIFWRAK